MTYSSPDGLTPDSPSPPPESVRSLTSLTVADVVTNFSLLDRLPNFLNYGVPLAHFARMELR